MRKSQQRPGEARDHYQRAIGIHRALLASSPEIQHQANLAEVLHNLALLNLQSQAYDQAKPLLDEALRLSRELCSSSSARLEYVLRLASVLNDLGSYEVQSSGAAGGLPRFEEAIRLLEPVVAQVPDLRYAKEPLVAALQRKAETLQSLERPEEAAAAWRQAAQYALTPEQADQFQQHARDLSPDAEQQDLRP